MFGRRLVLLTLLLFTFGLATAASAAEQTMTVPRFGTVHIYRPDAPRKHVALFISGDGGWNLGVVDMARALATQDTLVIGIDINQYLKTLAHSGLKCDYAAADFEALSQDVQQRLGLHDYENPVLVGYSSGATLAYAVAVEAPPGTFRGALSLGFSVDLQLHKPLCPGSGVHSEPGEKGKGVNFLVAPGMKTPWIVLQGDIDKVTDTRDAQAFVAQIPAAQIVVLHKVGHGFSVQSRWMPQFKKAFIELATYQNVQTPPADSPVHDLPLVEVPAAAGAPDSDVLALLFTGDGGWAGLDQGVADELAKAGIPVVGLNSLKYFWTPRDPATTARDAARIASHYLNAWHKQRLLLVGYSFGADILPFIADGFPADLKPRIALLAMIGADNNATFEFHVTDWMSDSGVGEPLLPVLQRLHGTPPALCIYGSEESHSLCRGLDKKLATGIELKGAHHFDGDYAGLTRHILGAMKR